MNNTITYTDEQIQKVAPSVFATDSWSETSKRYRFIPTTTVLNKLRDKGYNVTNVQQSRTRIEGKGEFTKHLLRLRHDDYVNPVNVGDEVPEIVLVNSHDRTSSYQIYLGIFRLVCTNGLIVASTKIESLKIRHSGSGHLNRQILRIADKVSSEAPKVFNRISEYKTIDLDQDQQIDFATKARDILKTTLDVQPERLLRVRRYADRGNGTNTLWNVSNIVQENIVRGGVLARNSQGNFRHTSQIKNIQNNVRVNRELWKLTDDIALARQSLN